MPVKQLDAPYPVIDVDPHFRRVVGYMRPNDFLLWGGVTASGPILISLWERMDPTKSAHGIRHAARFAGCMGFAAGFMLAYQNSSFRFLGLKENKREQEMDFEELSALAKAGKPLYGETDLSPYLQGVAARNSTYSQFKLQTIPWFNLVNHNDHGVDTSKYYNSK
ncbi:hypothetical protein CspHIS471_0503430 [Cutaneotrichosporon sp. HIS471]|nr:hypothetical protein CspHIS471_0503430 [Cutaneotrichosporon sp. HIS471]